MVPEVAIVILTKDNPDLLSKCLFSIISCTLSVEYKFYICDTGSSPDNFEHVCSIIKRQLSQKKYKLLQFGKYHFAANNNDIIQHHVTEPYVLLCNDDIEFKSDCIKSMLEIIKTKNNVATVGCRLQFPDGNVQHAGQIAYLDKHQMLQCTHRGYMRKGKYPSGYVLGCTAACLLLDRAIYLSVSGFDESYTECWEDIQFNMRLVLKNYQHYYIDDVDVVHHESQTRTKSEQAKYKLRYDYTYLLYPWFKSLTRDQQTQLLSYK